MQKLKNHQLILDPHESEIPRQVPFNKSQPSMTFKVIVIGDSGVGKSSLVSQMKGDLHFDSTKTSTVGFEFCVLDFSYKKEVIRLQVWDTCGQEKYTSLIRSFYRNASLAILTYAINSRNSFNRVDHWLKELKDSASLNIRIFLIGTKSDLDKEREISIEEGAVLAHNYKVNEFLETSAKTGENVKELLVKVTKNLYDESKKYAHFDEVN